MSDLIDRQKALDALGEEPVGVTDWDLGCRNQWEWDTEILRTMPSAEPEQKRGEWIKETEDDFFRHCSVCGYIAVAELTNKYYNFCPSCGAKVKDKENE